MMEHLSLGIVSSVDVSCGNAAFTSVLARDIGRLPGVQVELLSLDLELTQSPSREDRAPADAHIRELCARMRGLDAVNLQFEQGLFGTRFVDVARRLEMLLDANPRTFVTFHAVRTVDHLATPVRAILGSVVQGRPRTALEMHGLARYSRQQARATRRFLQSVCDRGRPIIVHTERSARRIRRLHPSAKVVVHPIRMVQPGRPPSRDVIGEVRTRLGLPHDAVTIGVFGYFGGYKGLDTAIRAMTCLPNRHHLLVFGRQHPQSIRQGEPVHGSVSSPLRQIEKLGLADRVHFLGELDDESFIDAAAGVDVCWLPYLEVDQDNSGIASITFDTAKRVIASSSFAFDEALRLIPYQGIERFDIGNHLELAQRTLSAGGPVVVPETPYTLESQAEAYRRCALGL